MQQPHGPVHINTFSAGAAQDTNPELIGATAANGLYIDGKNLRPVSNDKNTDAAQKIKGEALTFPNTTALANYECIGSTSCNENIVEFWADKTNTKAGVCRVNGVIVLQPPNRAQFPLDINFPLQLDKNESKDITEVFITDNKMPPFIFDIQDMVNSLISDPNKYFLNFEPLLYQVNLQSPLDIPAFIELKNVGGGGGLPVGQYQYAMRYSNDEGDRTQWSQTTPLIPVVEVLSQQSDIFPWVKTRGGDPNPTSVTGFAIHLRFRVTNIYNYQFIEIKRLAYNQGAGTTFVPNGTIVAKIGISPGEISVREYFDPNQSNVTVKLSETDETQVIAEIETAKAIRYFDRRVILMNVTVASKESNLQFLDVNGKQGFPVIDKLFKSGHKDPYNHTYRRNWMRGDKDGFGVVCFDGVGTPGFVTKIPQLQDFQFPNRRDQISNETGDFSLFGTARAANTTVSGVSQTHEVFDLGNPIAKGNLNHNQAIGDFKNIIHSGKIAGLTVTKSKFGADNVNEEITENNGEIENHGAHVDLVGLVSTAYHPYHPVEQNDSDVTGHNYITNVGVYNNVPSSSGDGPEQGYEPFGFAPDYYAMGMCVAGVTNFPKWAKAFSVVKNGSAKKVVCQGLGFYALSPAVFKNLPLVGNDSLVTKNQRGFWFHSPDIDNGMVSSDTLNDIIDNPQNYEMQFVSPLGYFSEVFGFENYVPSGSRDRIVDMITYVRMLRDRTNPNETINPNEDPNMGVGGGDGFRYVAYDKWRNTTQNPNTFGSDPAGGNRLIDIEKVTRLAEGRGNYLFIESAQGIYGRASTGGTSDRNFDDQGLKNWTEPMYMINIVRTGADVIDKNVEGFKQTTHYQKLESIIGKGTGAANQKYILVDERWEDCISAPNSSLFGANIFRFIFIKRTTGITETWVNVTFLTGPQRATIAANIASFGFDTVGGKIVTGTYTHENILNQNRFYNIVFDQAAFFPAQGDLIIVKYDNTAPIRVFGGDTYLGESIFAPIDRLANAKTKAAETQFAMGAGFPYYAYKMNVRHYVIKNSASSINVIQDAIRPRLGYIRQLCAMYTCETRCGQHLAYNRGYPTQFYPLINYVMRPNRWAETKSIEDNGIQKQYVIDYGEDEKGNWKWGGFRFLPQVNSDYSCDSPTKFFSRPEYGFVERTKFHTRVMWSLPRTLEAQASPSLKTFPANNSFDIDDNQGEIKRAWDAMTAQGSNLYAFTNRGWCMLITKKSILSDLGGNQIGLMSTDSFVKDQYWWSKDVGMYDEWWRSAAEGFVPVQSSAEGSEIRREAIFFANNESVFRCMDNQCIDIGRNDYHTRVYNDGIVKVLPGYGTKVTAAFDKYFQEYWLSMIGRGEVKEVNEAFVFGQKKDRWHGTNVYKFDAYSVRHNQTFGHRNMETYLLDQGFIINGAPISYELTFAASPEQMWEKEFIRLRVNSPEAEKPSRVEFRKELNGPLFCAMDSSIPGQGLIYMKNYRGFEQMISRADVSFDPKRPRLQNRIVFVKIIHNSASDFKVVDTGLLFKKIKG